MPSLSPNPGGRIDPQDIIGRDDLIAQIWETLEGRSIQATAERRIGKTCVIQKMEAEPRPGWRPLLMQLEGCHSADDFVADLEHRLDEAITGWQKLVHLVVKTFRQAPSFEVAGVFKKGEHELDGWKQRLAKLLVKLSSVSASERLVFIWDEFPSMLENIRKRDAREAMEILDILRHLRSIEGMPRQVLCGSIGLHHVLGKLKADGYTGAPVNDIETVEVPPLDRAWATELALRLLSGEREVSDQNRKVLKDTAEMIADVCGGFPFYIHHLALQMTRRATSIEPGFVIEIMKQQMTDPHDPWHLRHYLERIDWYYGDDAAAVLVMLGDLAATSEPLPWDWFLKNLSARMAPKFPSVPEQKAWLLDLLRRLEMDHYVTRLEEGYVFKHRLIKTWWASARGLSDD